MFGLQTVLVKNKKTKWLNFFFYLMYPNSELISWENTFIRWSGHIVCDLLYFTSLERELVCFDQVPSEWSATPSALENRAVPNNALDTGTQCSLLAGCWDDPWHCVFWVHLPYNPHLDISVGEGRFLLVKGVRIPCFRRWVCLVALEPLTAPGQL